MIREEHPAGVPIGTYDVFYYTLRHGKVVRDPGYDRDVPDTRERSIKLRQDEAAVMVCKSQSGGVLLFGSERIRNLFDWIW